MNALYAVVAALSLSSPEASPEDQCLSRVAARYLRAGLVVVATFPNSAYPSLNVSALPGGLSWILTDRKLPNATRQQRIINYLIVGADVDEIRGIVQFLRQSSLWNPRALFIVAVDTAASAKGVLDVLWFFSVNKAVSVGLDEGAVMSFEPYQDKRLCKGGFDHVVQLGNCSSRRSLLDLPLLGVNMRHCVLRVLALRNPPFSVDSVGVEDSLLTILAEKLNFSVEWIGVKTSRADALKRLKVNGSVDVIFGGFVNGENQVPLAQSTSYMSDHLNWYVLKTKDLPPSSVTRPRFLFMILVILAIVTLIVGVSKITDTSLTIHSILTEVRCSFKSDKFLYSILILSFLHMNTYFKAVFMSSLIVPFRSSHPMSTEDLVTKGFDVSFLTPTARRASAGDILQLSVECPSLDSCIKKFASGHFAITSQQLFAEYYLRPSVWKRLSPLAESIAANNIIMFFRDGDELVAKFDPVIRRVVESGLVDHWVTVAVNSRLPNDQEPFEEEGDDNMIFSWPLRFFLLGLSLSYVAFLCEITVPAEVLDKMSFSRMTGPFVREVNRLKECLWQKLVEDQQKKKVALINLKNVAKK